MRVLRRQLVPKAPDPTMCQLLGMNSHLPASLSVSFTGFTRRGGETDHHSDGWGVAFFESDSEKPGRGVRHFVDKLSATTSPIAHMLRSYPIKSHNVVAHVRKATIGAVALENCHPFVRELWGQYWVFAHNGDLRDFHPPLRGGFRPVGTTDSELVFCWLLQELSQRFASAPDIDQLGSALSELLPPIARHGTLNVLISNGQALWAHASTKLCYLTRQFPFPEVHLKDTEMRIDLAQLNGHEDRLTLVVTEPLTLNEHWTSMARGQLITFVAGSVSRTIQCDTRFYGEPTEQIACKTSTTS